MTKVRALRNKDDAKRVADLLNKHFGKQYEQIWRFALNVGLRMGDVLNIPMKDALKAVDAGFVEIKESKTGKINTFELNAGAKEIILARKSKHKGDRWLFQNHSNNSRHLKKPLGRLSVYNAIREVGNIINIKLGTHSARKTRARLMYEAGEPIEKVMAVLNHTNMKETMLYLDITQEEKNKTYHDYVF